VGVVSDEKFLGLAGGADPATYFPHTQFPMNDMWLLLRAKGDPRSLIPEVRRQVWALDANLPVENVSTMPELLSTSLAAPRFNALLMSLFAAAAMLIAAIGIYGVMSYMVAQRTGEIGVRMALGASRAQVLKLVVGQGVGLALVGIALGVVGALGLARVLTSLLYGVNPHDPVIFSGVAALLATVAILAAFLPAHRASRIEPVTALRYE
jgi:putative ABC transport system permease protein